MIKQLDLYSLCEANKYDEIANTLHMNYYYNEEDSKHYLYYGENFTKAAIRFYKSNSSEYNITLYSSSGDTIHTGFAVSPITLLNYSITNNGILFGPYTSNNPLTLTFGYFLGKNLLTNENGYIGILSTGGSFNIYNLNNKNSLAYSNTACTNSNYSCCLTPLLFEVNGVTILAETAYLMNVGPLVQMNAFNFKMNDKIYTRMSKGISGTNTSGWNLVIEDIE